jgi:hypothetical protein
LGDEGDDTGFADGGMNRLGDVLAKVIGVADGQVGVDPTLDRDAQGAPSPAGASMGVMNTVNRSGGLLGDGQHPSVDPKGDGG